MLCVPKLMISPSPTCMLRVINNDTNEEIPRVFQKVAPYIYKRNKVRKRSLLNWSTGYNPVTPLLATYPQKGVIAKRSHDGHKWFQSSHKVGTDLQATILVTMRLQLLH